MHLSFREKVSEASWDVSGLGLSQGEKSTYTTWNLIICNHIVTVIESRIIYVEVFRFVTPCSVVEGYRHFGEPWCLHLQGEKYDGLDVQFAGGTEK
jgi:hypothetical protein